MQSFFGIRTGRAVASAIAVAAVALGAVACTTSSTVPLAGVSGATSAPAIASQPGTPSPAASARPSPPTTPSASAATHPATPGATAGNPGTCTVGAKLIPTCGVLWGAAAGGFTKTPRDQALRQWEQASGHPTSIYHTYHSGDQLFPTRAEIAVAHQAGDPRLLLLNWKVAAGTTWARVAAGAEDKRIDREAAYLKSTFTDPFFMVLHHEPENDVNPKASSGMTAADFAAMFRHTVLRLRADGVRNAVTVVVYMNYEKWTNASWWPDLYPGDDVVDWIGVDTYLNADPGGFHNGDFASMMNRTTNSKVFPGFYRWATTRHPAKPVMLAEWGVYGNAAHKASIFATVAPELRTYPAVKALVYFDTPKDQAGRDIRINSSTAAAAAFRKVAASPIFDVRLSAD